MICHVLLGLVLAQLILGRPLAIALAQPPPPATTPVADREGQVAVDLDQAIFLFQGGDYRGSLRLLSRVLDTTSDPEIRRRARLYQGLDYTMLGETTRANRAFLDVLDMDPDTRLDPSLFAPTLVEAFERARRLFGAETISTVVSYREPAIRYGPEDDIPEQLTGRPWYKKWWVWGLAGVAVVGGALALTGGSRATYSPPVLSSLFFNDTYNDSVCIGQAVEVGARIVGGDPPYVLTWDEIQNYGTTEEIRKTDARETVPAEGTYVHSYTPIYEPQSLTDHRIFTFEVTVTDQRDNEGEVVRNHIELLVSNCYDSWSR